MIYLDHNATTPVRPEALDAMLPYLKGEYANASSLYQAGQRARKAVEDAREAIAQLIGADDAAEIVFTSGGTESNNMAIKGALAAAGENKKRIVSSAIEHSSVRTVLRRLSDTGFIDNVVIPVEPGGIINASGVDDAVTPDTALVSVMAANNEVGTLQPIPEISALCRRKGVPFMTDAVQMAGKTPIRVNDLGADLLSLSAHKFGGPKGVGILYIRKGTRLQSLLQGGRQERNRRGGTENVPAIAGMGTAATVAQKKLEAESAQTRAVRNLFEETVLANVSESFVNGDRERRIGNTTNICFPFTDSSAMIMALDLAGVACSSGSACAAGSADPSHVLLAMGLEQDKAHASLRFSFSYSTTKEEAQQAASIVTETVAKLRRTHPLWKEGVSKGARP